MKTCWGGIGKRNHRRFRSPHPPELPPGRPDQPVMLSNPIKSVRVAQGLLESCRTHPVGEEQRERTDPVLAPEVLHPFALADGNHEVHGTLRWFCPQSNGDVEFPLPDERSMPGLGAKNLPGSEPTSTTNWDLTSTRLQRLSRCHRNLIECRHSAVFL